MTLPVGDTDSGNRITLLQISDLHFSEHADKAAPDACHSVDHLIDLERAIRNIRYDRVIVSGDLSDRGNPDALLRARDFLFSSYSIGNGARVGLNLDESVVHLVPGNHDAFNTQANGDTIHRWQRSVENFYRAFPAHQFASDGCSYTWIQKQGWGMYLAFADTCFFGDPLLERNGEALTWFDGVAKGKLADLQAKKLLTWYDTGMEGNLRIPGSEANIPAEQFAASFKGLVMHHYLFEPARRKFDYMMGICERHNVFRNIALAEFDVLLCGHKHVPDFGSRTYGSQFDRRAKRRYILNLFRRTIGLNSLPLQFADSAGKAWPKRLSAVVGTWLSSMRERVSADVTRSCDDLIVTLRRGLSDSKGFRQDMKKLMDGWEPKGELQLLERDIHDIESRLSAKFSIPQRQQLERELDWFDGVLRRLGQRTFVQVLAGSACKRIKSSDKPRSFHVHTIARRDDAYEFRSQHFPWNGTDGRFDDVSKTESATFKVGF